MEWIPNFLKSFIAFAILLIPLLSIVIPVAIIKKRRQRFKNPLAHNMRRPAGTEVGRRLAYERDEIDAPLVFLVTVTPCLISSYFIMIYLLGMPNTMTVKVGLFCVWLWVMIYCSRDIVRRANRIYYLRLGYECELAVGQELDQLMLLGYQVFHDIPAGEFNIDHVVIGPTGVYAIETKGRSKRSDSELKKAAYKVRYDGQALHFPNHSETQPIEQAIRQANWVSDWLSKATAINVKAQPVLVLPGWWIDYPKNAYVAVLAGKKVEKYFQSRPSILQKDDIQRLAYQVDQKVRDLAPGEILKPDGLDR